MEVVMIMGGTYHPTIRLNRNRIDRRIKLLMDKARTRQAITPPELRELENLQADIARSMRPPRPHKQG